MEEKNPTIPNCIFEASVRRNTGAGGSSITMAQEGCVDIGDAGMPKSCPKPCVFLCFLPPQGVVDNYDANRPGVVDIYGGPRLLRVLEYATDQQGTRSLAWHGTPHY